MSVGKLTSWLVGLAQKSGSIPGKCKGFLFYTAFIVALEPIQPPELLTQCVKPPGHPHLQQMLRMHGAISPLPPHVFTTWWLIKQRDKFYFIWSSLLDSLLFRSRFTFVDISDVVLNGSRSFIVTSSICNALITYRVKALVCLSVLAVCSSDKR